MTATIEAQATAARRLYAWVGAIYALLVLCASLYPFDLDTARFARALADGFASFRSWRNPTRRDLVVNLLVYIPVGAVVSLALMQRVAGLARMLAATMAGAALSLLVELLQHLVVVRVPSVTDWTLNVVSSLLGAALVLGLSTMSALAMTTRLRRLNVSPALWLLVVVWLAEHAAPFMPRFRLSTITAAVRDAGNVELSAGGLAASMGMFLLLSAVLRTLLRRDSFWTAFVAIVAISIAGRLLFVGQRLTADEVLALLLALPIIARLRRRGYASAQTPVFVFICAAWIVHGLAPFQFQAVAQPFVWPPFSELFSGNPDGGYISVLGRAFLCIGAVWAGASAAPGLRRTTMLLLGITALCEVAQRFLPARVPDTTDAVLVLFGALFVYAARAVDDRGRAG